jgi:hypothetical protein
MRAATRKEDHMRDPIPHSADLLARGDASHAEIRDAQRHYGSDFKVEIDGVAGDEDGSGDEAASGTYG